MDFDKAVRIVLELEKGYVNDPKDPGGETNYGICKRSYPHMDIKNLTLEQAIQIYRRDFWEKYHCDLLPAGVNLMFFDAAVNHGPVNAARALQFAVGAKITGSITMDDMAKITDKPLRDTLQGMIAWRRDKYGSSKNWLNFGKGWMNRLMHVSIEAIYGSL